jgi:hypothetical protein
LRDNGILVGNEHQHRAADQDQALVQHCSPVSDFALRIAAIAKAAAAGICITTATARP